MISILSCMVAAADVAHRLRIHPPPERAVSRAKGRGTALRLAREFKRGLSFVGLARKYGMPQRAVEAAVRRVARRYA